VATAVVTKCSSKCSRWITTGAKLDRQRRPCRSHRRTLRRPVTRHHPTKADRPGALMNPHRHRPMALVTTHGPMAVGATNHRRCNSYDHDFRPPHVRAYRANHLHDGWVGAVGRVRFQSSK
jgi:hypothetical protein